MLEYKLKLYDQSYYYNLIIDTIFMLNRGNKTILEINIRISNLE